MCKVLDALGCFVYEESIEKSTFRNILNEKEPPIVKVEIEVPRPFSGVVVSDRVFELRSHPDFRIARRAATIAKLLHIISERKVNDGLRKTLVTQTKRLRLQWLADKRLMAVSKVSVEE